MTKRIVEGPVKSDGQQEPYRSKTMRQSDQPYRGRRADFYRAVMHMGRVLFARR